MSGPSLASPSCAGSAFRTPEGRGHHVPATESTVQLSKVTDVQLRNEPEASPHRQRCYVCFRPLAACFCDAIPSIDNRTHILILQHVKERFHAFNTARIVKQALRNSALIVDQNANLAARDLPFAAKTGVLYPGPDSRLLSEVPPSERPEQLVILDGTWHHAKTLMSEIPAIRQLPRFRLDPAEPSNYRIRKEPTDFALSTLEATVEALQTMEPETQGLDQLLRAFDTMVDAQLLHPRQMGRLRRAKREWQPSANIPWVVIEDLENVVVAYGEAAHEVSGIRRKRKSPVYWVARRLISGESFECAIQSPTTLSPEFLRYLELSRNDFAAALSTEDFRRAWRGFLRPTDTVAVFNESTTRLLATINAEFVPSVALKSVHLQGDCKTLDRAMASLKLKPRAVPQKGRAGRRLGNAIAFTEHLHRIGKSSNADSMARFETTPYAE